MDAWQDALDAAAEEEHTKQRTRNDGCCFEDPRIQETDIANNRLGKPAGEVRASPVRLQDTGKK